MSIKTIANLKSDADTYVNDNTARDITPADVRDRIKDLADSSINRVDDKLLLNLRTYVTTRPYEVGEAAIQAGVLYRCTTATQGVFNGANWAVVGASVTNFTDLGDAPASYSGAGSRFVRVNSGATGLEFVAAAAINISSFTNDAGYITGVPISANYIPKGNGTTLVDGTWLYSTNDIIPLTAGSNIGSVTNYIGTIFLGSTLRYASNLIFSEGATERARFANGKFGIGATPLTPFYLLDGNGTGTSDSIAVARAYTTTSFNGFASFMASNSSAGSAGNLIHAFAFTNDLGSYSLGAIWGEQTGSNEGAWQFTTRRSSAHVLGMRMEGTAIYMPGTLAVGLATATATIHAKGSTSGTGAYAFKAENSVADSLVTIRNDGLFSHMSGNFNVSYHVADDLAEIGTAGNKALAILTNGSRRIVISNNSGVNGRVGIPDVPLVVGDTNHASSNYCIAVGDLGSLVSNINVRNLSLGQGTTGIALNSIGLETGGGTYGDSTMRFYYDPTQFGGIVSDNNNNYYRIGIGINSVTTHRVIIDKGLKITAGTTTVAPFTLSSGTNKTTASAGDLEYNGDNLFFTPTGTDRRNIWLGGRTNKDANYTILATDIGKTIAVTTGGITLTLPEAASVQPGVPVIIKDESGSAGTLNITITPDGSETIDDLSSFVMDNNYQGIMIYSNGSAWYLL